MTTADRRRGWPFLVIAVGGALTQWWLSSQTPAQLAGMAPSHDKLAHATAWAALAGCLSLALWPRFGAVRAFGLAMLLAVGFGVVDEWHQRGTPGRDASGWDLVADTVGAGIGGAVAAWGVAGRLVYRRRHARAA